MDVQRWACPGHTGQRPNSKSRIWTCLGRVKDVGPSVILYHYTENKAGQHVRDMLRDWPGERKVYLQADAASNYDELYRQFPKIHEVGCWAHARRKFHEIAKGADKPIFAHEAVDFINQLFEIDRTFRESQDADRLAQRQKAATGVLDKLKGACETKLQSLAPKTPTANAIRYVIKHWKALIRYLEQPHLRPDNNAAERALRKAAIGRKNWLFAGSERGGEAAAIYYSLLETAKANGLNPWQWLTKTLTVLPTLKGSTYDDLKDLLPLRPPPAPA